MSKRMVTTARSPEEKRGFSVARKARTDSSPSVRSPGEQILQLQGTVGNQVVLRLIRSGALQAKLKIGQPNDIYEQEADRVADTLVGPITSKPGASVITSSPVTVARQPNSRPARNPQDEGASRRQQQPRPLQTGQRRSSQPGRPLTSLSVDTAPARIDNSKGVDEITHDFYHIPVELIPPNTPIPAGPILTIGTYGCSIRRYGLTTDNFSLTYSHDDADIQSTSRPFLGNSGLFTVQCWTNHVQFRARLRNTILLPNDLATHPCLQGENPTQFRRETLAHEHLHEADNNRAASETMRSLRERLAFTFGIGSMMAMVRITDNPEGFVQECIAKIHESLERLRAEHEIVYARLSAEYASVLDPHDRELHELKLRLLEDARLRASGQ